MNSIDPLTPSPAPAAAAASGRTPVPTPYGPAALGERWVPNYAPPPTSTRPNARIWLAIGCGVLAIAPFLTWANVELLGSLNLFQLYSANRDPAVLPWLVVLAAGTAGVLTLTRTPGARVVAIVVGFIAGGLGSIWGISLGHAINEAGGAASLGFGPFLALAGAVTMIVAGFKAR
jgi:hypothetical protein